MSSLAVAINLINNPRDFFKDAILRGQSGYGINNALLFSTVTRFTNKLNKVYSLIKNKNNETVNQFPYGMCNAYISDSYIDFAELEKDCRKFIKDQKIEVLDYLKQLDKFLSKAYADRNGEALQTELNNINAMPDDPEPSEGNPNPSHPKADALKVFYDKLENEDNSYMIKELESLEDAYFLELEIAKLQVDLEILSDPKNQKELQNKQKKYDKIKDDNPDNSILKTLYLDQLKLITENEKKYSDTIYKLSSIDEQKFTIVKDAEYLSEQDYQKKINAINQQKIIHESFILENKKEYKKLYDLLMIYRVANTGILSLKMFDTEGHPIILEGIEQGIISKNKEDIKKQEEFINEPYLEISYVSLNTHTENIIHNIKQRKYGNSMFWAIRMHKIFANKDCLYAGFSRNIKNINISKVFLAKHRDIYEIDPNVFFEEVYVSDDPKISVLCHIKKNTNPTQYGIFMLTKDDSPYLKILSEKKEKILKDKNTNKPLEFYPMIPIRELNKNLIEKESKLKNSCEELLRNLYININAISSAIDKIGKQKISIICHGTFIMNYLKERYKVYSNMLLRSYFSKNDSTQIFLDYFENLPDKNNRINTKNTDVDSILKDIYLAFGISIDNFDLASTKYLYTFFETVALQCNIDKEKFLKYVDDQEKNNIHKNANCYFLQNFLSIRNTHFKTDLCFNYIEKETFSGVLDKFNTTYIIMNPPANTYNKFYDIWDTASQEFHGKNSDHFTAHFKIDYSNNILKIYLQIDSQTYSVISVHGLYIVYSRRYTKPLEYIKETDRATGYYSKDIKNRSYRAKSDRIFYHLGYYSFKKDTQIAQVNGIVPKENKDLSNFIIPLWHHDITEPSYVQKDTLYSVNDVNNTLQKSINLLIFGDLQPNQIANVPEKTDYFVPEEHQVEVIQSCLDSFVSKFNKFETYNNFMSNSSNIDKQSYNDLFFNIGINPNVSAYCNVPPTANNATYMVGQSKVSFNISSQLMNNKYTFYFETLSQENRIFGNIKNNKFNFN